jgi:hypothetical protein
MNWAGRLVITISGWKRRRNSSSGLAIRSRSVSAAAMPIIFGACSPKMTCASVTMA